MFERAVAEAVGLDALWEHAHVLDVIFRAERSTYLDVSTATPIVG